MAGATINTAVATAAERQRRLELLEFALREAREMIADVPLGEARNHCTIRLFIDAVSKIDYVIARLPDMLK